MERRLRPGITEYESLDESRRSPLLQRGKDYSERQPAGAPAGPPPTWRPLAGASANNRGQARIVTLDTSARPVQPEQLVPSIVQSPMGMGGFDGELISVRLGLDLPAPLLDDALYNTYVVDVVCLLEFGVGGVSYTAEVDWNQGTVFGVSASFVRVNARVGAVTSLSFPPPIDIVLQASLGYGDSANCGISAEARRSFNLGNDPSLGNQLLAGATTAPLAIPDWAVGFTLVDSGSFPALAPVAPDYTIRLFNDLGGVNTSAVYKLVDRTNQSRQVEGQFPVPVGARFVTITNNLGTAVKSPRLIFNLAL